MTLGDHPKLFAAVMEALSGLPWAMGVHVTADDQVRGFRVTMTTGSRFLTHSKGFVIPVTAENSRDVNKVVRCAIAEAADELAQLTAG